MADTNINTNHEEQQFNTEMEVSLNLDQLSYICEYCGKVNSISAAHCVRCGKRRPRSEYVKAMSKIKDTKSLRAEFVEEQAKIEQDKKDAANQQLVRLVEGRVADEKAKLMAQQAIRLEQDTEAIKKMTAREAVLRIIAAENAAEERISAAEKKADDAVKGRNSEIEKVVADEREKALRAAAEKLVAERAGIEEAAKERIEANRLKCERAAEEAIFAARDEAERNAAKKAVLRVIAAEKANDDMLRMSKDTLQQAAIERIEEERMLAEKTAAAKYAAQKMAIEKAADERIKAEKEALRRILEQKERVNDIVNSYTGGGNVNTSYYNAPSVQTVQPLSIVPYLNQNQPVYQYNPNRVVYKFIPSATQQTASIPQENVAMSAPVYAPATVSDSVVCKKEKQAKSVKKSKKEKKTASEAVNEGNSDVQLSVKKPCAKVRILSMLALLLSLAALAFGCVLPLVSNKLAYLPFIGEKLLVANNWSIVQAFSEYAFVGINFLFKTDIAVPAILAGGDFFMAASTIDYNLTVLIPLGFTLFLIFDLFVIIQAVVRLISGKGNKGGLIFGLLQFVMMIVATVGIVLTAINMKLNIADVLLNVGTIAFVAVSLVIFVLTLIASLNAKAPKREIKTVE